MEFSSFIDGIAACNIVIKRHRIDTIALSQRTIEGFVAAHSGLLMSGGYLFFTGFSVNPRYKARTFVGSTRS
jgi:uncharacterized membrane protein